jgi:hypothetical protein
LNLDLVTLPVDLGLAISIKAPGSGLENLRRKVKHSKVLAVLVFQLGYDLHYVAPIVGIIKPALRIITLIERAKQASRKYYVRLSRLMVGFPLGI